MLEHKYVNKRITQKETSATINVTNKNNSKSKSKPPSKKKTSQLPSKTSKDKSTEKQKKLKPFWNSTSKTLSKKVWLPSMTDCRDSDVTSYNGCSTNLTVPSWYSVKLQTQKSKTPKMSFESLPVSQKGSDLPRLEKIELMRSRKIKLYPTTEQKKTLKNWFGSRRWVYNQCVNHIRQDKNFFKSKKDMEEIEKVNKEKDARKQRKKKLRIERIRKEIETIDNNRKKNNLKEKKRNKSRKKR